MKFLQIFVISIYLLPSIAQAEIWAYQIHGKQVSDCNKRPEASIDEVWETLEKATGIQFDISRDSMVIPGYILQNKEFKAEYQFYPSKRACEFEREGMAAYLEGDQDKLKQIKENLTIEKKLMAMSPSDIPQEQKQDWVNIFAGCTDGVIEQNTPLKGVLQKVVDHCDCTARGFLKIEDKNISQKELNEKIVKIASVRERGMR